VLDLDFKEDAAADVDMNVVMTGGGGMIEVQGTAEGALVDRRTLDRLLDLAEEGIGRLVDAQGEALGPDLAARIGKEGGAARRGGRGWRPGHRGGRAAWPADAERAVGFGRGGQRPAGGGPAGSAGAVFGGAQREKVRRGPADRSRRGAAGTEGRRGGNDRTAPTGAGTTGGPGGGRPRAAAARAGHPQQKQAAGTDVDLVGPARPRGEHRVVSGRARRGGNGRDHGGERFAQSAG